VNINFLSKRNAKKYFIPMIASLTLFILGGETALANCSVEHNVCKRKCLAENFGNLLGQASCNVECSTEARLCYNGQTRSGTSSGSSSSRSRTSTYESNTRNETAPSKAELSSLGVRGARSCVSVINDQFNGRPAKAIKNSCSERIKYSWCVQQVPSGELNSYKCDLTGGYSYSAASSVGPYDKKVLPFNSRSAFKLGACMDEVSVNNKNYDHISTERTGPSTFDCNYSRYGR